VNFIPVIDRELRVRARHSATYRLRLVSAGVALIVTGGYLWKFSGSRFTALPLGQMVFYSLTILGMLGCLFGGMQATADCVSSEKREGTLGLLFLTDLRGYDVIAGKWVASSLSSFFALVAVFPIMAIPLMLGGVASAEFWRVVLAMICGLFLALSVGLWVSVRSVDSYPSLKAALALMVCLTAGPFLLDQLFLGDSYNLNTAFVSVLSPAYGCVTAFTANYGFRPWCYWLSEFISIALGSGLFWHASRQIGHRWKEPANAAGTTFGGRVWQVLRGARDGRSIARLRSWLDRNPFTWLVLRTSGRETLLMILAGVALAAMYLASRTEAANSVSIGIAQIFSFISAVFLRLVMIARASQSLVDARRNGAMELILCTPMEPAQLVRGIQVALRRSFWALMGVEILACCLQTTTSMGMYWGRMFPPEVHAYLLFNAFASVAMFAADLFALGWVGMWLALSGRAQNDVIARTFLYVIVAPWLLHAFFSFGAITLGGSGLYWLPWAVWPAVVIAKDLIFVAWAARHLETSFREVASGLVKPGFWPKKPILPRPNLAAANQRAWRADQPAPP
jgi:ABC-type transport system involved in multi-copper enzyme maturation permease subunit